MRLLRYERDGRASLGALAGDGVVPLDGLGYSTMLQLIQGGASALDHIASYLSRASAELPVDQVRLLPPLERPGKYLGIGMNYGKHADEAAKLGFQPPSHQLWFNKQTSCIAGPFDDIDPGVTEKLDYEVELAVVIGRSANRVAESEAKNHVFGYLVANDVSARDWQFHSPTFTIGKSFDTHGPIGPWIVTSDEIPDPHQLDIRCFVNGELRQSSNTSELIHSIWAQVSYLSTAFTLEPGDLLATGTPSGVGIAMDPPRFLQLGDIIRCEIEAIGAIENRVGASGSQRPGVR